MTISELQWRCRGAAERAVCPLSGRRVDQVRGRGTQASIFTTVIQQSPDCLTQKWVKKLAYESQMLPSAILSILQHEGASSSSEFFPQDGRTAEGDALRAGPAPGREDPGPQAGPGHLRQGKAHHRHHRPPHLDRVNSECIRCEFAD